MPELPRPHISSPRNVSFNTEIEPDTDFYPETVESENQELLLNSINKALKEDNLNDQSYLGEKQKYDTSQHKKTKYQKLKEKDPVYAQYITKIYGSYEVFLKMMEDRNKKNVINPKTQKKLDVTIITDDMFYKSDHIAPQEIIMEALSGICTVDYLDVSGNAQRLNGTLQKKYILGSKAGERYDFFSPLPGKYGEKIVLWNINKQKWSSFYFKFAIRFVKDDTIDLE